MESVGHGLEDFDRDVIWARGLAFGHAIEAASVSVFVDLAIEHGWGEGRDRGEGMYPWEWSKESDRYCI